MRKILILSLLLTGFAMPPAHAGILEEMLAIPAIQGLLGRLPELPVLTRNCEDPAFKQRNVTFCQQVEGTARLANMPHELRQLMAQPKAAASLRELCLAANGGPTQNSYLCAELYKADTNFGSLAEQRRQWSQQPTPEQVRQQQNRESPR